MGNCICCINHICTEACSRRSDLAQVKESIQVTCTYSKHHSAEVKIKEISSLRALIKRQQEEEEDEDDLETEEEEAGTTDRSFTLGSSDAEEVSTGAMSSRTLYEQMNGFPPPLDLSSHHRHRRDKVDGHLESDLSLDFTAWISNCCHKQYVCNSNTIFTDKKHTEERKIDSSCDRMKLSISSRAPLRIFTLTWNVNGKRQALHDLRKFVSSLDTELYDLFVVGLQEVPNSDAEKLLINAFGEGHSLVATASMSSLQLFVISRSISSDHFKDVRVDRVGAGVYGAVTGRQKGAVAVSFMLKDAAFLFVASHLSPHESNVEERNSEFQRISQSLFCPKTPPPRLPACLKKISMEDESASTCKINGSKRAFEDSDLVVWLGDLNYRIQDNRNRVDDLINQNRYTCLKHRDQLSREIEKGNVFRGFREGPLSFRPTYKYDVGTDNYDTSPKERVPSWTDRILYRVKEGRGCCFRVAMCDYDAIDSIKSSDHRPVQAVFSLSPW